VSWGEEDGEKMRDLRMGRRKALISILESGFGGRGWVEEDRFKDG
jgi:hypothetical protein